MRIAEIAYPLPLDRAYSYLVPPHLEARLLPGMRVRAPFGPRTMTGIALAVKDGEPSRQLKAVEAVLDQEPLLPAESLELARWLARSYCASVGECLKLLLPAPFWTPRPLPPAAPPAFPARPAAAPPSFTLTASQANAVEELGRRVSEKAFSATLLFGVPASGKTEVYLRLIRRAAEAGGQSLFLLPEISLTAPFFEEFRASLELPVALWHSQLGARERRSTWLGLRSGSIKVVVGARSACLLPFADLRLAVVDEEQDESFKQEGQAPLYHARDVVLERARRHGAAVVLGTATPSLEAYSRAAAGEWGLVRMDERVSRLRPPPVAVLAHPNVPGRCLSPELLERIKARLAAREQAILLVNRRGYSNFSICRKCGWVSRCDSCSVALIHHQDGEGYQMRCHHCGRRFPVPSSCGRCRLGPLQFSGTGTQKVVSELKAALPGVRVLRMDRDTVSKQGKAEQSLYAKFLAGEADVLVGTKLVAKGFHFPRVTLVGIVDADTMLHMPDFRSAERTAQLLVQVAGRSGRADRPGEVCLQTSEPAHYAIQAVARGEYEHFARQELEFRRELAYPPSATLVRLLLSGPKEETVREAAKAAAGTLRERLGERAEVLGPAPGVHAKLQGRFRHHMLVKAKDERALEDVLSELKRLELPSTVRPKVNVDPYDLF